MENGNCPQTHTEQRTLAAANAKAASEKVINNDEPRSEQKIAQDAMPAFVGIGRLNRRNHSVNLESILGKSRFDK